MRLGPIVILLLAVLLLGPAEAQLVIGDRLTLPQITTPTCKTYWIEWPTLSPSDSNSVAHFYSATFAALGWWEGRTGPGPTPTPSGNVRFAQATDKGRADVVIQFFKSPSEFVSASPEARVGQYIHNPGGSDLIQLSLGMPQDYIITKTEWKPFGQVTVWRITLHEIGHFLGFDHSSDPNNVMYPEDATLLGALNDLFGYRGEKLGVTPMDGGFKERLGDTPCPTRAPVPTPAIQIAATVPPGNVFPGNAVSLPTAAPQPTSAQTTSVVPLPTRAPDAPATPVTGACLEGQRGQMGLIITGCKNGQWTTLLVCGAGQAVQLQGNWARCQSVMAGLPDGAPVPLTSSAETEKPPWTPPPSPTPKQVGFEAVFALAALVGAGLLYRRQ